MAKTPIELAKKWDINDHSSGGLNGHDFEKEIPHNMRFKEFDYNNPGGVLRWVTEEPFSDDDINQFKNAMSKYKISKAHVVTRDDHTGDWNKNLTDSKGHVIENPRRSDIQVWRDRANKYAKDMKDIFPWASNLTSLNDDDVQEMIDLFGFDRKGEW